MNERIEKLGEQAVEYALGVCDANGLYQGKEYLQVVKEKFAELIVGECVRKIEDIAESSNDPQPIYRVAVELLEHFGVEE